MKKLSKQVGNTNLGFDNRIMSDLLVTALEGGSNYWCKLVEYIPPKGMTGKQLCDMAFEAGPKEDQELFKDGCFPLYSFISFLPKSVNWKMKFETDDGKFVYLTPRKMHRAARLLVFKRIKVYANILAGNYDALDADVWFQYATLGENVYG